MTILSDFISEVARELDRQRAGGPLLPGVTPERWTSFVKMLTIIDRATDGAELREKLERIAEQTDVPYRKRLHAMAPLLLPLLPIGSVQ